MGIYAEGDRLSYEALRYQIQCACRDVGIAYKGEHIFAIPFATNCYYKGMYVKFCQSSLLTPTSM